MDRACSMHVRIDRYSQIFDREILTKKTQLEKHKNKEDRPHIDSRRRQLCAVTAACFGLNWGMCKLLISSSAYKTKWDEQHEVIEI
jgi:hypothetical protein